MLKTKTNMRMIAGMVVLLIMGNIHAANDAGTIKTAKGIATIVRDGKNIAAKPGSEILVSDKVTTGVNSSIGITLRDGTLLSAGANSTLVLNKFILEDNGKGGLDASLQRGTLAVISGKLSKTSPDAVSYRTPTAILGVRGTEFVMEAGSAEN